MIRQTVLGLALLAATPATALQTAQAVSMRGKEGYTPPPDSVTTPYFTTDDGCTYRRAQAPGFRPTWHLIINPHHLGKPRARRGCPGSLRN
ncbi:hypothetical protein [Oceanicola sp. 22II-s10i]|uniref:hypothetical protein n=1 Tax=Oceanicola sp. 22II-s10i TaxID=1317116 RepID=UPI000B5239DC|nr:hypothetical protein [Oceanicola sp. 22II-s10i]